MAVVAYVNTLALSTSGRAAGNTMRFVVDTFAEMPTDADVIDGDSAYCVETARRYVRTAGAWAVSYTNNVATWGQVYGTLSNQADLAPYLASTIRARAWSTASQGPGFAADTYVTSSGLLIPSAGLQAGQWYRWEVSLSKTAAGTATPIVRVRIGTTQSLTDTARLTLTGKAAAAVASGGQMIVTMLVRSVGASGVTVGSFGFVSGILGLGGGIDGVSAAFDTAGLAGQYVGLSFNAGTAAAVTVSAVHAELIG